MLLLSSIRCSFHFKWHLLTFARARKSRKSRKAPQTQLQLSRRHLCCSDEHPAWPLDQLTVDHRACFLFGLEPPPHSCIRSSQVGGHACSTLGWYERRWRRGGKRAARVLERLEADRPTQARRNSWGCMGSGFLKARLWRGPFYKLCEDRCGLRRQLRMDVDLWRCWPKTSEDVEQILPVVLQESSATWTLVGWGSAWRPKLYWLFPLSKACFLSWWKLSVPESNTVWMVQLVPMQARLDLQPQKLQLLVLPQIIHRSLFWQCQWYEEIQTWLERPVSIAQQCRGSRKHFKLRQQIAPATCLPENRDCPWSTVRRANRVYHESSIT